MWGTIDFHTNIGIGIMVFIILIALYLIFFGKEEVVKEINSVKAKDFKKENYVKVMSSMNDEEKRVIEKLIENQGTVFQSDLVDKLGIDKVKITRILDKLEGRSLIERRRRGMTNVVILK
jgi:uncharacterized membrane protein